ncbi:MAG: histidine--tRNA ligase [Moraxella sp.]|nr:histidine--tRNA ligase [Moraxella sp.]
MNKITAIRGFNDILPSETGKWRYVESVLSQVLDSYGYSQIRLPLVEETQLFARGVGEATDIVEKEMFGVVHGGGKGDEGAMTLRPEGTAGCVRAVVEHNLTRGDTPKLWYMGAMFRYERPQKGRYRQFTQLGVESFGSALPDADAELIAMTAMMWQRLGIGEHLTLQLNTLGEAGERMAYKEALVGYLTAHFDGLDDDSQRRVTTNPLRVLDSKDEQTQAILLGAPKLSDFLGQDSRRHFEQVQDYLHTLGIDFEINERLVRGLDYYNKTVFEWVTDKLGAQATVCAGGRYDGLVGIVRGKVEQSEPAVGFALGLERLMLLIDTVNPMEQKADCDVFVVASEAVYVNAVLYANELRTQRADLRVKMASATSLKAQMKKADKSGAKFTVIIGDDEVKNSTVSVKNMETGEQSSQDWTFVAFDLSDKKSK